MKQPESKAVQAFKKNVIQPGDRFDIIKHDVGGFPDVSLCIRGVESWIEFKAPEEPMTISASLFGSNHKMLPEQIGWMKRQCKAGGNCYILIATDIRWMLLHGGCAQSVNTATLNELIEVALWQAYRPLEKAQWNTLRWALGLRMQEPSLTDIKLNA